MKLKKKFFLMFIYFGGGHSVSGGRAERERRERISDRLLAVSTEPSEGLELMKLWDHDPSRDQESDT